MKKRYHVCPRALRIAIFLAAVFLTGCGPNLSERIKEVITDHTSKTNPRLQSVQIQGLDYKAADSSSYYKYFLNRLEARSEMFSKLADLKARLAKSQMDRFLAADKKADYRSQTNKTEVDKSLEDLKANERQWNKVNDSMDLMLNAVHTTDTLRKVFYEVSFSLEAMNDNKKVSERKKAILTKDNLNVVLID